ncbi:MAG: M20/M25/M40 family metallo-hydrolase, partial [Cytophagales bacterium]|nr:M20/M25/M40 family metallo-hydrolase [Cytophagales bacterium]
VYKIDGTHQPDSFLVITAHYDHLGRMGPSVYFPGANDNASGIAFLLEMADYFKNNPPKYTVVFIAFAAEEIGLLGSEYFVNHPLIPLENIKFLVNLDLVGTGDDGIQVVNSTIFTKEFAQLKSINDQENYFQTVKTRGKAANSDHYHFSEKGVPSFFIYALGGITAYHDINDTYEKLPLTKFKELFQLTLKFLNSF